MPLPMTEVELDQFTVDAHHGYDPYERRYLDGVQNFTRLPHCLHFFYMGFDGARQDFRHYYHDNGDDPIAYEDVPELLEKLSRNAIFKDYAPPKHGVDFLDIIWRRRCYVAILMDSPQFRFWENRGIMFLPKNGGFPNYSFFDARDLEIDVPAAGGGSVRRTALFCINHMKADEVGNDIGSGERKFYSFQLVFRLGGLPDPWEYDPGGTNQGPPIDP